MNNNILNYGTQGLDLYNWNNAMMVPNEFLQSENPLDINAGRQRLSQQNPAVMLNNIPQTQNQGSITNIPQEQNTYNFGTPNWDWINFSNTVRSGVSYAGEYFGNSRQNAVLDYNQDKLNPLNYLPRTSNTSQQDRYGIPYFDEGGSFENDEWNLFFEDDNTLQAPSDIPKETKSKKQVVAEKRAKEEALSQIDALNSQNFYNSLSFNTYSNSVENPYDSNFAGIFANEGARTGQPTNLNSSAIGRGQMIKSTRESMYRKLGLTDIKSAEAKFKSDPNFEMTVLDTYRKELDSKIPKDITGPQREYMIAKGWYTGDVNYNDDAVPHPEAGNKLTAGEYARRAINKKLEGGMIYQQGEEYDVSSEELKRLKDLGYSVEIL